MEWRGYVWCITHTTFIRVIVLKTFYFVSGHYTPCCWSTSSRGPILCKMFCIKARAHKVSGMLLVTQQSHDVPGQTKIRSFKTTRRMEVHCYFCDFVHFGRQNKPYRHHNFGSKL